MKRIVLATSIVALALVLVDARARSEDEGTSGRTKNVEIPTARGVKLEGVLHEPAKPNGVVVVFGSGRGYHKDLPLLVRSAEMLQAAGFTALRFDWAYFTAKGKHAPDLSTELQDLDAALAYARKLDGIGRLYLAGKSLGSVAALMKVEQDPDGIDGLMMLTFPIHPPKKPDERFDGGKKLQALWKKPLLILCGDADPYSELGALYRYAAGFDTAPALVIVPGDHGLHLPSKDEAQTRKNVELAAHGLTRWAEIWAGNE